MSYPLAVSLVLLAAAQGIIIALLVGDRILLRRNDVRLERELHQLHEDFTLLRREVLERMQHIEKGAEF